MSTPPTYVRDLATPKLWPGGMGDGFVRIKGTVVGDSIYIKHRDLEVLGEDLIEHGMLSEDEGFDGEDEEFDPAYFVSRCVE
jgi:hypothetical protein